MNPNRTLKDMVRNCPGIVAPVPTLSEQPIVSVEFDSRKVETGSIFVAIEGEYYDGHTFIENALNKGAALIVGTQERYLHEIPEKYLQVEDARIALAYLSAAFYDFPARKMTVIGVTGTDGKTTTTNLIYHILKSAGIKAGMVSTVNAVVGDEDIDTGFHVTTPEAPMVQELLARMVQAGLTHVVLETTSHGLDQHRVAACEYDIGVITNVTHEHLDYHKTYENYVKTKGRLFTMLPETVEKPVGNIRLGVLNRDDRSYPLLKDMVNHLDERRIRCIAYSRTDKADVSVLREEQTQQGLRLQMQVAGREMEISSGLVGVYNVSNILAAVAAVAIGLNIDLPIIQRAVASFPGIPGRMEKIDMGQNFSAIVDFAHTPNALQVTLETARRLTDNKVIVVFGSAGLRDREKRKIMAAEGVKLADVCILTAEDPRTEKLEDILGEMSRAAQAAGGVLEDDLFVVPDRGQAIRKALQSAKKGDLVIVCGKGHEQSMCFETTEYPWDDRVAMRAALAELLGVDGPAMPYLPTQE